MYDATDGRRTAAHGALLVTIGLMLGAGAPAAATAAPAPAKPYIVVYKPTSPPASRATTADISAEQDVTATRRFTSTAKGFAARLDAPDRAEIREDPRVVGSRFVFVVSAQNAAGVGYAASQPTVPIVAAGTVAPTSTTSAFAVTVVRRS